MLLTVPAFLDHLLADATVSELIGTKADVAAMLHFEAALASAEAEHGLIPAEAAAAIAAACKSFKPDIGSLTVATLRDGVVVPDLVRQLRLAVGEPHGKSVHFGATSQDVIDTALAVKLKAVFALFEDRLVGVVRVLDDLLQSFGAASLMGRTRMQAAIPITAGDRLAVWRKSLERVTAGLAGQKRAMLILTLAGAAGTAEKFGDSIAALRATLAADLGLAVPDYVPHADRLRMADFANWLSLVTGALGKIGQDIALMAQTGIEEIALAGGGGSSAMPHKQNPVRAEVLVALARFNAVQLSGMHQALAHEQERSGAAWTLEWLVLPRMIETTAVALVHTKTLLQSVTRIGQAG